VLVCWLRESETGKGIVSVIIVRWGDAGLGGFSRAAEEVFFVACMQSPAGLEMYLCKEDRIDCYILKADLENETYVIFI